MRSAEIAPDHRKSSEEEFIDVLGLRRAAPQEMNVSFGLILIAKEMPLRRRAITRSLSFFYS